MCNSFNIRTSKVIGPIHKVSEITGNLSKQYNVQIQAKDQVKKFIELVKPKKWEYRSQKILSTINKSYEEAFSYVKSPYDLNQAEKWKVLLEQKGSIKKLINFLKNKGEFTPTESSFKIWMEKLLTTEGYQKWIQFNTNILIDDQNLKIQQFPQILRVFLCKNVSDLLKTSKIHDVNIILDNLMILIDDTAILRRLSYLLNDPLTEDIIKDYLKKLVLLVKVIRQSKKKLSITKLKKELDLPFHRKDIKEIFEILNQKEIIE